MATIDQSLNRNLAAEIVDEMDPAHRGRTLDEALRAMFGRVMALNPATEVYLLDPHGRILRHAAPPEKVKRDRVDVGRVQAFLDPAAAFPLYGDDPRDPNRLKAFCTAPVREAGQLRAMLFTLARPRTVAPSLGQRALGRQARANRPE
jgi:two-component system, OmpR family, sensor kinase